LFQIHVDSSLWVKLYYYTRYKVNRDLISPQWTPARPIGQDAAVTTPQERRMLLDTVRVASGA